MGTKIKIKWSIKESGKETIDLEELNVTDAEWNSMSEGEKDSFINELFYESELELVPNLDSWTETND